MSDFRFGELLCSRRSSEASDSRRHPILIQVLWTRTALAFCFWESFDCHVVAQFTLLQFYSGALMDGLGTDLLPEVERETTLGQRAVGPDGGNV